MQWTGKCIGHGNIFYFKIFVYSLCSFMLFGIILGVLYSVDVKFDDQWMRNELVKYMPPQGMSW